MKEAFYNVYRAFDGDLYTNEAPHRSYDSAKEDAIDNNGSMGWDSKKFWYYETIHRNHEGVQILDFSQAIEDAERNPFDMDKEARKAYLQLVHS